MRVQCDGCERAVASVMCCADEAALCTDCDIRVHAANKLANKHQRVSLMGAKESPRCDICQEKSAFFFCLEDRALLCRDCDVSIHSATALSSAHQRFLVPGTKVALEALSNTQESAPETSSAEDYPRNPLSVMNNSSMINSPSAVSSPAITSKPSYHASYRQSLTASASFSCPPVKLSAIPQKMTGMNVTSSQISHGSHNSHGGQEQKMTGMNVTSSQVSHGSHNSRGGQEQKMTGMNVSSSQVSHGSHNSRGGQEQKMTGMNVTSSQVSHGSHNSRGGQEVHGNGNHGSQVSYGSHGSPGVHTAHGSQVSHISHCSQVSHGSQGSLVSHGSQGSLVSHGSQGSQASHGSHGSAGNQPVHSSTPVSQAVQIVQGNSSNGMSSSMTRRPSITEFLSEAIPSWRVDELLNIPELADGYSLGDIASSKADVSNLGEYDWTADLSLFDEQVLYNESFHEVPQMSSSTPLTALVSRPGRTVSATNGRNVGVTNGRSLSVTNGRSPGVTKGKAKQNSSTSEYGDAFVVPDLGIHSVPASPPVLKRRRQFVEV